MTVVFVVSALNWSEACKGLWLGNSPTSSCSVPDSIKALEGDGQALPVPHHRHEVMLNT